MSLVPGRGPVRRRHRPSQDEYSSWTLGQSFNAGAHSRSNTAAEVGEGSMESDGAESRPPFISKLPSAVTDVSQDVRSYVHSKRVTNYLIGSTLGEGSFAKVKEGFHALVGEKVAVKVIDKKRALQDAYVNKNFRREAKLLQMVRHPNILQLLEVVETDNSYYLITELCSGGELMKHIYKENQLGEIETRKYMRQMVSAVDHLHKAGIIHRDLKVENLLLDSCGNIKIIDFGLSNEEYTMEDGKRIHCSTQCGSPAYAAPELLGHKAYGPEVDVWSLGVNMYAMLTGCLPYTVEPFNITALHAKMLENKMNPIPSSLSEECNDLLRGLLTSDPKLRIKMPELIDHPWMTADGSPTLKPHPFPNKLTANDINEDIVEHMVHVLKLKEREQEVTEELLTNRACATSAVYCLFLARLERYTFQKSKVKLRRKLRYDPHVDDDTRSTLSYRPARPLRPVTRQRPQATGEEQPPASGSRLRERRNTLPEELMKKDIEKIQQTQALPPVQPRARVSTMPRLLRNNAPHDMIHARPSTQLNPVRPTPAPSFPTSISHPRDLNKLQQELNRHAWTSQPPSQASLAGSRNTAQHSSRQSSRNPSAYSRHASQSNMSNRLSCPEYGDIEFHEVDSSVSPPKHHSQKKTSQSIAAEKGVHFPSLTPHTNGGYINHQQRRRSHESKDSASQHSTTPIKPHPHQRTNGYWAPNKSYTIETEGSAGDVISGIETVAKNLNISCTDRKANTLYLKIQSTKLQVHVEKDQHHKKCQLSFQWLQGGSQEHYDKICSDIFSSLLSVYLSLCA